METETNALKTTTVGNLNKQSVDPDDQDPADLLSKMTIAQKKKQPPTFVSLELSKEVTEEIVSKAKELLRETGCNYNYSVCRGEKDIAHITLAFNSDFPTREEYEEFLSINYSDKKLQEFPFIIQKFYVDKHCVCCTVQLLPNEKNVTSYPKDRNLHITLMLEGKPPVYSNELIKRLKEKVEDGEYILQSVTLSSDIGSNKIRENVREYLGKLSYSKSTLKPISVKPTIIKPTIIKPKIIKPKKQEIKNKKESEEIVKN